MMRGEEAVCTMPLKLMMPGTCIHVLCSRCQLHSVLQCPGLHPVLQCPGLHPVLQCPGLHPVLQCLGFYMYNVHIIVRHRVS